MTRQTLTDPLSDDRIEIRDASSGAIKEISPFDIPGTAINVKRHRAVGDATKATASWTGTDNTTEIQEAIDEALDSTYSYGSTVILPPGNFLAGELDLTAADARGLILQGCGWQTRLIANADTTDGLFKVGRSRITIRDMILDGNAGLFDSNLIHIVNEHGWGLKLINLQFVNSSQVGLLSTAPTTSGGNILIVDRCIFQSGDLGFVTLDNAKRGRISNSIFQSGGALLPHAIKITNTQNLQGASFKIDNNWFEWGNADLDNSDDGIGISRVVTPIIVDAYGTTVVDNYFTIQSAMTQITAGVKVTSAGDQSYIGRNNFGDCGKRAPNIHVESGASRVTLDKNRGQSIEQDLNATMLIEDNHLNAYVDVIPISQSITSVEVTAARGYSSPAAPLVNRSLGANPVSHYSKVRGHLAPAHQDAEPYTRGDMVSNAGGCYYCITNGSSGTGTPPTSTTVNSDETDGTAHWTYMGHAGEFYSTIDMVANGGDWA